ncbi:D-aminoacylase [Halorubrum sp. 48-1-W]|uniref:N-acyl-D-amino-acid deacylase family protein n=1 Tax=Halorubrum sp. 48-1-W TaxID=2249761 RepID=UPI000DCD296A|nr:D-aminoacylase [Halorubrum sp. 48-1-W]RAW46351.1 D-aminoacylase [Halorubrum sp. 48-1-W]
MTHDVLIENARIVDGTGAPWFRGAVTVEDGRITDVFRGDVDVTANESLDVEGKAVCPGFIDTHSHSDLVLFEDPTLAPKLRQGITTEILGQDGFSMAPMYRDGGADQWARHLSGLAGDVDVEWSWGSVADYLDTIEAHGIAPNVATLVGHGTVRFDVLGMDDRAPTDDELEEMADLVADALEDGAVGFSTGLVYSPQVNASTEETQRLAAELEPYGRPFVAHIRSEGRWIWEALDEFVDIGADENVPLHLSHFKVSGTEQHGKAERATELVETARERGVDITAEQYPYTAGNTLLSAVLPPWVHAEGPDHVLEVLRDETARERIRRDIEEWRIDGWENQGARSGWENIVVRNLDTEAWREYEGESVADIAADRDQNPVLAVCDILLDEELSPAMILHTVTEPDVRDIMASERVGIATDGLFGAYPHPRTYGTYPRVLGTYVREENHLSLEDAVRKMTSLPARAMGLDRKGVLRPGMDADLVVFDPVTVESRATFENPRRFPSGVPHVMVDGTFVVRNGEVTDARPGTAIKK